jgi:hypothetical protein
MTSIREQHERAMELADFAFAAKRVNDRETAARLFHDALDHERSAANAAAQEKDAEPTRSVLYRSAASLAIQCAEYREAERMIAIALCGEPPEEIAEELRDLLVTVHKHLRKNAVEAAV